MPKNKEKPLSEIFDPKQWEHTIALQKRLKLLNSFDIGTILEVTDTQPWAKKRATPVLYRLVEKIDGEVPVFRRINSDGTLRNDVTNLIHLPHLAVKLYEAFVDATLFDEQNTALDSFKERHRERKIFYGDIKRARVGSLINEKQSVQDIIKILKDTILNKELHYVDRSRTLRKRTIIDIKERSTALHAWSPSNRGSYDNTFVTIRDPSGADISQKIWLILNDFICDPTTIRGWNEFGREIAG